MRLLAAGQLADELLDHRHARRAADEDHVVDLRELDARVLYRHFERAFALVDEVGRHALELRARQLLLKVQRAFGSRGDEWKVDRRFRRLRQLDLGLLGRFLQALEGHAVVRQVDAVLVLEL